MKSFPKSSVYVKYKPDWDKRRDAGRFRKQMWNSPSYFDCNIQIRVLIQTKILLFSV